MVWRPPGDKPLSEPMIVSSLTPICVTQPQWVKYKCQSINRALHTYRHSKYGYKLSEKCPLGGPFLLWILHCMPEILIHVISIAATSAHIDMDLGVNFSHSHGAYKSPIIISIALDTVFVKTERLCLSKFTSWRKHDIWILFIILSVYPYNLFVLLTCFTDMFMIHMIE